MQLQLDSIFSLSFLRLAAPLSGLLLCPFGPIAPLHFVHLCSGHSKLLVFQCGMLPHALHLGLGQFASMWPYCWQRSHTSSLGRSLLLMRSVAARDEYADSFGRTFARGKAGRTACAAHSIRTRVALLAVPRSRVALAYKSWGSFSG